jgi:multidrug efflux pump subunit AcrA (membrane-fusion protein)
VQRRNVSVGITTANRAEILTGLSAGDQVITSNLGSYQTGEKVVPKLSALGNAGFGQGAN